MKLQTKEEIKDWLDKYSVKNYTINNDLTVDVRDHINLSNKELKEIPLKFGTVSGNFNCSHNKLKNLEFSPKEVGGSFDCSYNKLTSLKDCNNIWLLTSIN